MNDKPKQDPKKKALEGYKKVGTKFLPPMNHLIGPMKNVSYFRLTMPELIWWDVVAQNASDQFSVDLAAEISKF
ncbi:MAG TPA: hypothetical protein VN132_05745, partial [Bdellovibrio sp.]|nr:hypothetical protein [Bdellovibrio sp.]